MHISATLEVAFALVMATVGSVLIISILFWLITLQQLQ